MTLDTLAIEVSFDSQTGAFSYEVGGQASNGDIDIDANTKITWSRKSGESWTFQKLTLSAHCLHGAGPLDYPSHFVLEVSDDEMTAEDRFDVTEVVEYEYCYVIDLNGTRIPADPKLINRPSVTPPGG